MEQMIKHNKPTLDDSDIEAVLSAIKSNWIAPGPLVLEFECEFSNFLGSVHAAATNSGTSALHLALYILGVRSNDEVILPTYVCSAVLNAIYYIGAKPVLVDINEDDLNLSFRLTYKALTSRTKAIILPHIYGAPADINAFHELGQENKIFLIEDCAQAIGAKYNSDYVGTFGDAAIFSFYATKIITTAQGGMITSKHKDLIEAARDIMNYDFRSEYKVRYNYKMTDLQASLGLAQLRRVNEFIYRRKKIAQAYDHALSGKPHFSRQRVEVGRSNVFFRYVIFCEDTEGLIDKLKQNLIGAINPLQPFELLHRYLGLPKDYFPVAEASSHSTISLPIYPSLTDQEVFRICEVLEND